MFPRMKSSWVVAAAALALAAGACEKSNPTDEGGIGGASGKNPWNEPGAKSGKKPGKPKTKVAAAGGDVRAPTAEDLATYTKGLKGNGPLTATIKTTMGDFHCELFGDKSPATVANFVGLATGQKPWLNPKTGNVEKGKPFYDGLIFHRVIAGFMVQGGDPLGSGMGGPGYDFDNESDPSLKMEPGTLAMANAGKNTNGSQFFITEGAPDELNGGYTIFGRCKETDLVKKIEGVPQNSEHRPNDPVSMTSVTISK
jgi:peptidyl-prolyl cis-trans isomerase A (cyclophilin A)